MNNTNLPCSLNDATELRKLILENPDLPLLIFCGSDVNGEEYGYEQADNINVRIETMTLYKDRWLDTADYVEELIDDLADNKEYKNLSDEEFEQKVDEEVDKAEFVKGIIIYIG